MPLPSQFVGAGGRVVTRRRRRRRNRFPRLVISAGLIGLLAVSVWAIWPGGGTTPGNQTAGAADNEQPGRERDRRLAFLGEQDGGVSRGGGGGRERRAEATGSSGNGADDGADPSSADTSPSSNAETRPSVLNEPLVIQQGSGGGSGGGDQSASDSPGSDNSADTLASPERGAGSASSRDLDASEASERVRTVLDEAADHRQEGRLARAREVLNEAMFADSATEADRAILRDRIASLNERLLFSPDVHADDPICERYTVQSGDTLARIARNEELRVGWRLIQRVNRLPSPGRIRVGQSLKLARGPFHAVIDKSAFRLDAYWGPPDAPDEWIYIRSFPVGLGEDDSTPVGRFRVRADSRLQDPAWTNPRTGEKHPPGEDNPIGRYWIGMAGEGDSASLTGYGIHGTNEPSSIGQQRSMGCIRLSDEHIGMLFSMLVERHSAVRVVP